jgi:hypothetical protein
VNRPRTGGSSSASPAVYATRWLASSPPRYFPAYGHGMSVAAAAHARCATPSTPPARRPVGPDGASRRSRTPPLRPGARHPPGHPLPGSRRPAAPSRRPRAPAVRRPAGSDGRRPADRCGGAVRGGNAPPAPSHGCRTTGGRRPRCSGGRSHPPPSHR